MGSFADSINANCNKILAHVNKKCYSITWQLFTNIVYLTPVLKGELINSWFPTIGPTFSSEKSSVRDLRGSGSLSRINSIMNGNLFLNKDGVITMANNEDYAYRAEMLGWPTPQWSGKVGPYGMVRIGLTRVAAENR